MPVLTSMWGSSWQQYCLPPDAQFQQWKDPWPLQIHNADSNHPFCNPEEWSHLGTAALRGCAVVEGYCIRQHLGLLHDLGSEDWQAEWTWHRTLCILEHCSHSILFETGQGPRHNIVSVSKITFQSLPSKHHYAFCGKEGHVKLENYFEILQPSRAYKMASWRWKVWVFSLPIPCKDKVRFK